jgi:hypothetical protein
MCDPVSQKASDEAWMGDPLPRGRHKLPPEAEVRAGRIDALLELEDALRYLIVKLLVGATAAEYVATGRA